MNAPLKFKDPDISKDQAVKFIGSKAKLARALGLSRATVTEWKSIPLHHQYRLAQMFPELSN